MRCILFLSLPLAFGSGLKPVSYGSSAPVQTLFPLLSPSAIEGGSALVADVYDGSCCKSDLNHTDTPLAETTTPTLWVLRKQDEDDAISSDSESGPKSDGSNEQDSIVDSEPESNPDSSNEEDPATDSEPELDDSDDETFLDPGREQPSKGSGSNKPDTNNLAGNAPKNDRNVDPNGVTKGEYAGELQFDCLEAPEQCQNVCWYQNCVRDPNKRVEYMVGNDGVGKFNRVHSGVTTQNGGPCTTGPFGQKFWDTYPFNKGTNAMFPDGSGWQALKREAYLETDEWPMASFDNPVFDPKADPIQRSPRCITGESNGFGGTMIENFLTGQGPYNSNHNTPGYRKYQGKWAHHRKLDGELGLGDWFHTNANFDSFDDRNTTHQKIMK